MKDNERRKANQSWMAVCTFAMRTNDAKTAKKKELQRKQSGEDVCTELENLQFAEVDLPHDWASKQAI